MPPRHQRRTCLDWGCSRHAKLPQVPQISAGLALPTEELLSPRQPHWNCQRVRLSNDSIEQNPFDTLPCKSGNKASLASPTGWILALTARRGANATFRQDRVGPYWVSITSWQSTDLSGNRTLLCNHVATSTPLRLHGSTACPSLRPIPPAESVATEPKRQPGLPNSHAKSQ